MATNVNFEAWMNDRVVNGQGQTGKVTATISLNDVFVDQPQQFGFPAAVITAISIANPTQLTFQGAHGLASGDKITIQDSNSTPTVDGERVVTFVSSVAVTVPVNVTGAGTKGNVTRRQASITADKQLQIFIDDTTAKANGIPSGWYQSVNGSGAGNLFRRMN